MQGDTPFRAQSPLRDVAHRVGEGSAADGVASPAESRIRRGTGKESEPRGSRAGNARATAAA